MTTENSYDVFPGNHYPHTSASQNDVLLKSLTVVIPAYNEHRTIAELVGMLKAMGVGEILVVDDGSTDNTGQLALSAGARVIFHGTNKGYFSALRTGYTIASKPVVVFIDADMQQDPTEIASIIKPIFDGSADMVIGSKFLGTIEYKPRILNLFIERLVSAFIKFRFGVRLTNTFSGYRSIRKEFIQGINVKTSSMEGMADLTIKAVRSKGRIIEVPRTARARKFGKSKVKFSDGFRIIKLLLENII